MPEQPMKWVLLGLMAATIPVPYFLVVVGGWLPLVAIATLAAHEATWGGVAFDLAHVLVFGAVFYWIATIAARRLARLPPAWGGLAFVILSVAILAISFMPIYGLGHNDWTGVNLYRLFIGGVLG